MKRKILLPSPEKKEREKSIYLKEGEEEKVYSYQPNNRPAVFATLVIVIRKSPTDVRLIHFFLPLVVLPSTIVFRLGKKKSSKMVFVFRCHRDPVSVLGKKKSGLLFLA